MEDQSTTSMGVSEALRVAKPSSVHDMTCREVCTGFCYKQGVVRSREDDCSASIMGVGDSSP